jgi:hypothetical protein
LDVFLALSIKAPEATVSFLRVGLESIFCSSLTFGTYNFPTSLDREPIFEDELEEEEEEDDGEGDDRYFFYSKEGLCLMSKPFVCLLVSICFFSRELSFLRISRELRRLFLSLESDFDRC